MKKKSLLVLVIAAMLVFAGCAGEKGQQTGVMTGAPTETPSEVQGEKVDEGKEAAGDSGEKVNPTVAVSPEKKELSEHLKKYHGDEMSAQLVEKGYFYEVNESLTDGIFQIDFKAVTGDMRNPVLVFDVYVNDAELTAKYDEIKLHAYVLGEEAYTNHLDSYGTCEGIGTADELVDNLYHVTMPGPYAWMTTGTPFVVDVCQVDFMKGMSEPVSYPVNVPENVLSVSQYKFYPVLELGYEGLSFTHGGRKIVLKGAEYGQYRTRLDFFCYENKDVICTTWEDFWELEDSFQLIWKDFLSDVTLEADGKVYTINDEGNVNFSDEGNTETQYRGRGFAYMENVNFSQAKDVKIWVGTVGYDLKSGSSTPLSRELPAPTPTPELKAEQKDLAELIRNKGKDDVSAGLVEKGYYHMVNETRTDEIFRFDFKALTGDEENLMMVFDVYVEDAALTEMYPMVRLDLNCVMEEYYDPEEERWSNCSGYGFQDPDNKKLYHVVMKGYSFGYAPTITEVCGVAFDTDTVSYNGEMVYNINVEPYYTDVPLSVFAPVLHGTYYGKEFSCDGRTYELESVMFGNYYADVRFCTEIDAEDVPADDDGLWDYYDELQVEWAKVFPTLTLVVDGVEYKVVDEDGKRGYVWFNVEEGADSYRGEVHPFFPAVDYFEASVIELKAGDTVYRLK